MTLQQWTIDKTEAGMTAVIDSVTPIDGTGSLQFDRGSASGSDISITASPRELFAQGFTSGRCRHLFRVDAHSGSTGSYCGIVVQKSQENLTAGAGSAYGWIIRSSTTSGIGGNGWFLHLMKYSAGLVDYNVADVTEDRLADVGLTAVTLGTAFAMELEWLLDVPNLGGVRLIGRYGVDFDNLTDVRTYVDTSSPLETSVNEGPLMFCQSTGSITVSVDRTRHRRILTAGV